MFIPIEMKFVGDLRVQRLTSTKVPEPNQGTASICANLRPSAVGFWVLGVIPVHSRSLFVSFAVLVAAPDLSFYWLQ